MGVVSGLRRALNRTKGATGTACEHESVEWTIENRWGDGVFETETHGLVYVQYETEYKRCADCHIPLGEDGQSNPYWPESRMNVDNAYTIDVEPIEDDLDGEDLQHSLNLPDSTP